MSEPHRRVSPYGYIPTDWVCATFIGLFGASTLLHLGQAIYFRLWWLLPTVVLAGIGEVLGWTGRYWSSQTPRSLDPFLMQICATILAPTFFVAANFIILGKLITKLGTHYSRLSPKLYAIVFIIADTVALIVQAVGGASASRAVQTNGDPERGGHIMLGGIVFQMVAITIYAALAFEFVLRFQYDKPLRPAAPDVTPSNGSENEKPVRPKVDFRLKLMLLGLCISTLFLFIRSVYRTIELVDGWTGRIIETQLYFNVLDGMPITVAMYTLNILHPGFLLYATRRQEPSEELSTS